MKNRLPRRHELFVLIALSLVCTIIVKLSGSYDVGLAMMGALIFLIAALMGFRRVGESKAAEATVPVADDEEDSTLR